MIRYCSKCKERMMIFHEGTPKYTYGAYILYGCPSCGNVEYQFEDCNCEENPIKKVYDPQDINKFHVSN
jgi:hypothetical protein